MSEKIHVTLDTETKLTVFPFYVTGIPPLCIKASPVDSPDEVVTVDVSGIISKRFYIDDDYRIPAKVTGYYYPEPDPKKDSVDVYDIIFTLNGKEYFLQNEHISFEELDELTEMLLYKARNA